MARGFARIRTQDNSHTLVNPDEVVQVTIDDRNRPNGMCTITLRNGTRVKCWDNMDDVELQLQGAR